MKNVCVGILLLLCLSVSGKTYYVAPNGSDLDSGNVSLPFATLNKAWTVISAGDTIYLRGGTYAFTDQQFLKGKSGTLGNLINVWAYPDETPVLTRGTTYNYPAYWCGIFFRGDYFYFRGLEITGYYQETAGVWSGLRVEDSNNNIFELLNIHHNGQGLELFGSCNGNLILNCDIHHNADPLNNYGNADGLQLSFNANTSASNTIKGCRLWWNTDDGLDLWRHNGSVSIEDCWSWYNGYMPDTFTPAGDGQGFKLGVTDTYEGNTIRRTIKNCVAYSNHSMGFDQNDALCGMEFFNNISYLNGTNGYKIFYSTIQCIVKNNISYNNGPLATVFTDESILENNTFLHDGNINPSYLVSDEDFSNLDGTQLARARKADGSLPDIDFLHLNPESDLVDRGVDVGLPYAGDAPDLGAFELYTGAAAPVPVYVNSVIQDETPTKVEISYSLDLTDIIPDISAFSVQVNSVNRVINLVAIFNGKVYLTLASEVVFGDNITVAYTQSAINPLQTSLGGLAESINPQPVINNCRDPNNLQEPPVIVLNYETEGFSGFVYELDASGSYDTNNDDLSFEWVVPSDVSVSSTTDSKIQFLAPIFGESKNIEFTLTLGDGIETQSEDISINIQPYRPELATARIETTEASDYFAPNYPNNVADLDTSTKWSVEGNNNWLVVKLATPFKINHIQLTFISGQKYSMYFDIYASNDNLTWDPIITPSSSCNFSGDPQFFNFPLLRINTEYSYLKFEGHGNSLNTWNHISEFNIYGFMQDNSGLNDGDRGNIFFYPNPAHNRIIVSVEKSLSANPIVKLINLSGKIVYEDLLKLGINVIDIPDYIETGIYVIEFRSKGFILDAQKLVISR